VCAESYVRRTGHCKSKGLFLSGKGTENHKLGNKFFLHHRTVSAVKTVEFVSDRMLYILVVLRGRWCNIVVLNVHAPSEEKSGESKTVFKRN